MLITADEVEVQTGQTYTGIDLDRVNSFIQNVSDAVEAFCRKSFADPAPGAVKAVALIEVRRLLNSEPGVSQERISELSSGYAYGGAAIVLSADSEKSLTNYLRWTSPRYGSIRLVSPTYVSNLSAPSVGAPAAIQGPADLVVSGRTVYEGLVQVQYSLDGFTWTDLVIAESADISDGGPPYWTATLPTPAVAGSYRWRARFKYDGDLSKYSLAVQTVYEVSP